MSSRQSGVNPSIYSYALVAARTDIFRVGSTAWRPGILAIFSLVYIRRRAPTLSPFYVHGSCPPPRDPPVAPPFFLAFKFTELENICICHD